MFRGRGYITADAREQTAYGTARGYIAVGMNTTDVGLNTAANQFSANRAFVQFAGITAVSRNRSMTTTARRRRRIAALPVI